MIPKHNNIIKIRRKLNEINTTCLFEVIANNDLLNMFCYLYNNAAYDYVFVWSTITISDSSYYLLYGKLFISYIVLEFS